VEEEKKGKQRNRPAPGSGSEKKEGAVLQREIIVFHNRKGRNVLGFSGTGSSLLPPA